MGTGVIYHTDRCEPCTRYTEHLYKEREERNGSLKTALEMLERYWGSKVTRSPQFIAERDENERRAFERGFDRGYDKACDDEEARRSRKGRERSLETQRTATTASSSGGPRQRSPKGKRPMTGPKWELEEATKELEMLKRRYAQATAEISRLQRENESLTATLQSRAIEAAHAEYRFDGDDGMDMDYVQPTNAAGRSHGGSSNPNTQVRNAPSSLAPTQPRHSATTSYASVASDALKRKANELSETAPNQKKPRAGRPTILDAQTGLPVPLGREGIPHLHGGPWEQFIRIAPGETLDQKVEWLVTHRYKSIYREVREELEKMRLTGGRMHPLQLRVLDRRHDPDSLQEIAHNNPSKRHPGVRMVHNEPLAVDLVMWELIRTINRSSRDRERNRMIWQTVTEVIMERNLWAGLDTQSTGIRPLAYPDAWPINWGNMVVHLRSCGVTTEFWHEMLRPFIVRGLGQPVTVAPEPVVTAAVTETASTLAASPPAPASILAAPPPAPASVADATQATPVVANNAPSRQSRSASAPPVPSMGTTTSPLSESVAPDGDVPMGTTETTDGTTV
jgi:hypothetical protein